MQAVFWGVTVHIEQKQFCGRCFKENNAIVVVLDQYISVLIPFFLSFPVAGFSKCFLQKHLGTHKFS